MYISHTLRDTAYTLNVRAHLRNGLNNRMEKWNETLGQYQMDIYELIGIKLLK